MDAWERGDAAKRASAQLAIAGSGKIMSSDLDVRRRRAAYRAAHRGTKEMDWLLGRYASAKLDQMSEPALTEFEALLAAPDPQLQRWIMDTATVPDDRYAALIRELRQFYKLSA